MRRSFAAHSTGSAATSVTRSSSSLAGRNAVDQFLFVDKRGYCEQFSSSFVVLMRAAGIPARVVGGYAGAEYNPVGEYWIVRRSDAHAWAEVWSDGRGWVRVDPTAAVAPERVFDTIEDRAATGDLLASLQPMWDVGDWMLNGWNEFVLGFNADRQRALFRPFGLGDIDTEMLLMLFSLVALSVPGRDGVAPEPRRAGARSPAACLAPRSGAVTGSWAWPARRTRPRSTGPTGSTARGPGATRPCAPWACDSAGGGTGSRPGQPVESLNALLRDLRTHRP